MARSAAIQRAYALARSGECRSVAQVMRRLADEDRAHLEEHLGQPAARRELILVCSEARLLSA